jgi:ERCC4-type nuclease
MSVDIVIDAHEEKLISALESSQLQQECGHLLFDIETLDVGDIVYKQGERLLCLIERKTLDDYVSSIIDKRSKNQSIRISQLRKEYPDLIIIYLIEGQYLPKDHRFRSGITRDALYTSLVNRVIRDHFTVYHTRDIEDTALIVTKLYDRLVAHLSQPTDACDERIEYLKTIKLAKKDNMTPTNCYVCQLSQIPGVSIEIGNVIAEHYPTMAQLLIAYQQSTQKQHLLSEIPIPIANDKVRRLGHVISERIYQYIHGITSEETPATPIPPKIKLTIKKQQP